ncbi:hypothetical protein K1T71_010471 [Dendrolimus kikuchii]|uniref:Uncharacterized protein n=1 Tax=Dendrolimus kikuchii TaxID=765133 RepID=A0ACC1CS22_9NEOP|nr:hypothetical protein K1T71_010471 [Dendrolimus kikuchii]
MEGVSWPSTTSLVVISVIACSYAAQLDRSYLPPPGATAAGGGPGSLNAPRGGPDQGFGPSSAPGLNIPAGTPGSFGQPDAQYGPPSGAPGSPIGSLGFGVAQTTKSNALGSYQYQPERARASLDRNAETLRYDNRIDGDTFAYSFETSNGITADESGIATNGVQAQGGFAYTADDGQVYRVTYTADQNGYQPQGEHLPTPHPIPEEILKSIEENARAAAAGIQEGAYDPNEGTSLSNQQYTSSVGFNRDQGYQYDTPSAGISRSDTATINSFQVSQQSGSGPTSSYQYNAPSLSTLSGSLNTQSGTTGYQSQPTSQYIPPNTGTLGSLTVSQGTLGTAQPNKGSSRPSNQYIPAASGQGYNPSGSSQTVQIGSRQQYNAPSAGPTSARPVPNPTASGPSPSGIAPSGPTAGPTSPTSYTSSSSISPFAVSNNPPSGFSPSGPTASGPSPSAFASTGPSPSTSGFAPSSPTANLVGSYTPSSAGVQISEYSKAGQVSSQKSDDGYNYNRPQPGFSDSRTPQTTPAGSQRPTSSSNQGFIINVQSSTGSDQTPQGQYQPNQPSGSRTSMTAAYEYNRPGTQPGAPGTAGTGKSDDGRSGAFGGPRQPPSFSQDEGYKY